MTHLAHVYRPNWMRTACGKMIQRQALAAARRGAVPFIDVHHTELMYPDEISQIKQLCTKCVESSRGPNMLSAAVSGRLLRVSTVHVQLSVDGIMIHHCCGAVRTLPELLLGEEEGTIPASGTVSQDLAPALRKRLCSVCLRHPKVVMEELAVVQL